MTEVTHTEGSAHVLKTPIWLTVIRGFIVLISIVILGLSAYIINGAYIDELGLCIAAAVLTWIVIAYVLVTEKVRSAHSAYHIIAVIALDAFMWVMWLASFAATAAKRAQFTDHVKVTNCYNDGSLTNSNYCWKKREIEKREVLLFRVGAAMMAAIAGLGALVWILFTVCLVWESLMLFRGRKEGRFLFGTKTDEHQMQNQTPTGAVEKTGVYQQQQPAQQQPIQQNGQYQPPLAAGQYPSQGYASPGGTFNSPSPVSPPPASISPYQPQQQATYPPPQEMNGQQPVHSPQELYAQQQQYQQQPYQYHQNHSPQGYPAQQQQQQPQSPHHGSPSPVPAYHGELDAHHAPQYSQSTSPPPQTTQQPQ